MVSAHERKVCVLGTYLFEAGESTRHLKEEPREPPRVYAICAMCAALEGNLSETEMYFWMPRGQPCRRGHDICRAYGV